MNYPLLVERRKNLNRATLPRWKRWFDAVGSLGLLIVLSPPMLLMGLMIRFTSNGPALYWSDRIGVNNSTFKMPKFRTMHVDTPTVATHLLVSPERYLTTVGRLLRRYSLDELPQLFSVLKGDMSIVGPRPALFNQADLIQLRTERGVHRLVPGITGWAQINGRDDLPIPAKVNLDAYYLSHRSLALDMKILWMTFISVADSQGIAH